MTLAMTTRGARVFLITTAIFTTVACVFLYARSQALSATVSRPGAASTNIQTFAFPAISGKSTFDVVSLPETDYKDEAQPGSSIFAAWDGTATTSNYMNFAHMGQNSETSDDFLLQFFNQTQCIVNPEDVSVPGPLKEERFTATFTKPNLTPTPSGQTPTRITIRAYDHFEVTWGEGSFTVTMRRYWRPIALPPGETPESYPPERYYVEQPLDTDVPSPQTITKTLVYTGDFAPFSSRINHGQPYDTENFSRPADVVIDEQKNLDFNFFDITTEAEGQDAEPDEVTCRLNANTLVKEKIQPCGCLNNNDIKACGDATVPFIDLWPPVQFSLSTGTVWQIKDVAELKNSISAYGEQFSNDGTVRLEINNYDATPGEPYSLSVLPMNFKTTPRDSYFSWCLNGKSQQGLVAGGDWIEETRPTVATEDADSAGCCDYVTRETESDGNGDGIDDEWQRRYGFKLTGNEGYLLPANYDEDASGSEATTGLGGDGFVADEFLDANAERIAVTPGSVNARSGQSYKTGDGVFSAAEEYVWGTDPTEFDTDQDGFPDEADIVGVGQTNLDFVSQLEPREFSGEGVSDRYSIKVKMLGRVGQMRTYDDQETSESDSPNITRIAEDSKFIFARDPGEMLVSLTSTPESPGLRESFTVNASLVLGTRAGGNPVFYWYAKRIPGNSSNPGTGQPTGEDPFLQGEGINKVEGTIQSICPECQPGDSLEITLQVDDTLRGQVATDTTTIEVGDENSLQIFQDCNKDGLDEEVGSSTYCFASGQVTKNIPVRVSSAFLNIDPAQYYFQWRVNGVIQTSNCLLPNVVSTATPVKCGFGTNQMVFLPQQNQADYPIELLVYRNDRPDVSPAEFNPTPSAEIAHFTSTITSGVPAVTIVFEPSPATLGGGYPVGTSLTARAKVDFLNPLPNGQLRADPTIPGTTDGAKALRYVWKNSFNEIIKVEELASIDGSTVVVNGDTAGVAELRVFVTTPDYVSATNPDVPVVVSGGGITYFESGAAATSLTAVLQARLASILSFLPAPLVRVVEALAVVVFGAIIVLGFALIPRQRQKSA